MANGLFNLKQVVQAVQQGGWPAQKTPTVEYLVVAGGGSTGSYGGGGAGGLLTGIDPVPNGQTLLVTVGGGGAAGGGNGSNSVFGAVTANGGGSSSTAGSGNGATSGSGVQGTSGQGNAGGDAMYAPTYYLASGGGGAGTRGLRSVSSPGAGGQGIASDISGTRTAYAGGGGGGQAYGGDYNTPGGAGGGGAAGGTANSYVAQSGSANTGGGAGGTSYAPGGNAGNPAGGSGIVILSYPDVYAAPTATTGSPTVSTSGSGSISFGGTQYLDYAAATPLALGSGDFTFECWFYKTDSADVTVFAQATGGFALDITPANGTIDVSAAGISYILRATQAVTNNVWNHVAVTRSGNTFTIYYNGVSIGSTASATTFTNNTTRIARAASGGQFTGYLSNLRLVKGVVVYTGAFTPPTAPLRATQSAGTNISAITGTATGLLLTSVSGSFLADISSNSYVATVTGTPTWNQLSPFSTGLGYKNRVYTWTSSGSITF